MSHQSTHRSLSILAIDIGSSSARTEVFDQSLTPVPGTFFQQTYQLVTGSDGRAELDVKALLDTVVDCMARSVASVDRVDAIGISCFWHSLLGVDERFSPVTDVMMWADTRAAAAITRLATEIDPRAHHQATGSRLHSSYPMAKLRWLAEDHPETSRRVRKWLSFPEYLQQRITGILSVGTSMASGTGLLNRTTLTWDANAMHHASISPDLLSQLDDDPVILEHSIDWPQLRGAKWFPAIGDGAANNLGSYAVNSTQPALMIGTTGALRLVTSEPPDELPSRLWQYRLDGDHALLGGALSEGGGVIAWLVENLRTPGHDELERQIASSEPDGHGLTVLPYLAGERSPNWHSEAVGTIHGLRFDTRGADIVQATMESIGYSFAGILEDLAPLLEEPVEIIATGNALRQNLTWAQMIADIVGYPLLMPRTTESSLRGAALHVLRQLGEEPETPNIHADSDRFEPRSGREDAYTGARRRQAELYQILVAG